jgi:biopolymer transport protein ExbD
MTPMLDIVFIMLIFFIVTSVFVKESGVDVTRPRAVMTAPQDRVGIIIGITDQDVVWINNKEVELRAVKAVVEKLQKENPQGRVVIKADGGSSSGSVIEVLDQVEKAGVDNVAVAASKKE